MFMMKLMSWVCEGGIQVISHIYVNGKTVTKGLHDLMNLSDIGSHIQVLYLLLMEKLIK